MNAEELLNDIELSPEEIVDLNITKICQGKTKRSNKK